MSGEALKTPGTSKGPLEEAVEVKVDAYHPDAQY